MVLVRMELRVAIDFGIIGVNLQTIFPLAWSCDGEISDFADNAVHDITNQHLCILFVALQLGRESQLLLYGEMNLGDPVYCGEYNAFL